MVRWLAEGYERCIGSLYSGQGGNVAMERCAVQAGAQDIDLDNPAPANLFQALFAQNCIYHSRCNLVQLYLSLTARGFDGRINASELDGRPSDPVVRFRKY